MSGIVGFLDRRGSAPDRSLLEALTGLLAARGPDGRGISVNGPAALGHTLLRTVRESDGECQPIALGGRLWITADARLDRRAELIAAVERADRAIPGGASDAELILRAYAAWSEDCVQYLHGDFAFAIWDAQRRIFFCARDHFGVKPFYYADLRDFFLFSNTLECVLAHPDVSDELNERAIADFLLRGFNSDLERTSFQDVRRLPPSHFLVASQDGVRTARYWSLPVDGRIRYGRPEEYVENFQAVFDDAVADRLRCDRAGIWLSGGMDSSTVAATARALPGAPTDLRAFTMVYDSLIADVERNPAQQVADFLKIPVRYLPMDDLPFFGGSQSPTLDACEPLEDPFFAGVRRHYETVAGDCRVILSGEGADGLMHFQMWAYVRDLFREKDWRTLLRDVPAYLRVRHFPWKGIRERIGRVLGSDSRSAELPDWISPDLAARLDLKRSAARMPAPSPHPFAPMAHAFLSAPQWSAVLEIADPGATHVPVETRYPFLDLRVVEYLLAIPPFPWSFKKRLLREAMAGRLPGATLERPKTPLAQDPIVVTLGRLDTSCWAGISWDQGGGRYLETSALQRRMKVGHLGEDMLRPLCLNFWLQSRRRIRYKIGAEVRNG